MNPDKILETIPVAIRTLRKTSAGSLSGELTFQQLRILILCYEGMGVSQMAQTLQVSAAAVSKMVDTLVKKGFLLRETAEDRRFFILTLTEEGDKIRKAVRGKVVKELKKSLSRLSADEEAELERGLEILQKLMGYLNEK